MADLEKSLNNYRKAEVQIEKYQMKIDDLKNYQMKQVENLNKIIEQFMSENGGIMGLVAGSDKNSTIWQYSQTISELGKQLKLINEQNTEN